MCIEKYKQNANTFIYSQYQLNRSLQGMPERHDPENIERHWEKSCLWTLRERIVTIGEKKLFASLFSILLIVVNLTDFHVGLHCKETKWKKKYSTYYWKNEFVSFFCIRLLWFWCIFHFMSTEFWRWRLCGGCMSWNFFFWGCRVKTMPGRNKQMEKRRKK